DALGHLRPTIAERLTTARQQAEDKANYEKELPQRRSKALDLLHEPLYAGTFDQAATRAAAASALSLTFRSDFLTRTEQEGIRRGHYEMLLVLAEAEAHPLSGQSPGGEREALNKALAILDQADRLGIRTAAIHWRKSRYQDRLGDYSRAAEERERAASFKSSDPPGSLASFLLGIELYQQRKVREA